MLFDELFWNFVVIEQSKFLIGWATWSLTGSDVGCAVEKLLEDIVVVRLESLLLMHVKLLLLRFSRFIAEDVIQQIEGLLRLFFLVKVLIVILLH